MFECAERFINCLGIGRFCLKDSGQGGFIESAGDSVGVHDIDEWVHLGIIAKECFFDGVSQSHSLAQQMGQLVPQLVFDCAQAAMAKVSEVIFQSQAVDSNPIEGEFLLQYMTHLRWRAREDVNPSSRVVGS